MKRSFSDDLGAQEQANQGKSERLEQDGDDSASDIDVILLGVDVESLGPESLSISPRSGSRMAPAPSLKRYAFE
jgi:hypothetical protein